MSPQDILDIAGLIHSRWSDAFDILEQVRFEKNDGSPDWAGFHKARLNSAKEAERKWLELKNRFTEEHREDLNKMFGL